VSKSTSPLLRRVTENEKGFSSYLNSRADAEAEALLSALGRSKTEEGTW